MGWKELGMSKGGSVSRGRMIWGNRDGFKG